MLPPDFINLLDEEEVLNDNGNNKGVNELLVTKREKVVTKRDKERKMNDLQMKVLDKWIKKMNEETNIRDFKREMNVKIDGLSDKFDTLLDMMKKLSK